MRSNCYTLQCLSGGTTLLAFKDYSHVISKTKATTEVCKESLFLSLSVNIPINKLELALKKKMYELASLCTNGDDVSCSWLYLTSSRSDVQAFEAHEA